MTIDLDDSYLSWDGEPVTFIAVRSSGTVQFAVATALRRALRKNEPAFSTLQLKGHETVWNLPAVLLVNQSISYEPAGGDAIKDANDVVYRILENGVEHLAKRNRWRCITVKER